jgi:transglutaminase-like putative cysteine protease
MYYNNRKVKKRYRFMKRITTFFLGILLVVTASCFYKAPENHSIEDVESAFNKGQLKLATQWADSLLNNIKTDSLPRNKLLGFVDQSERIKADFKLTESEVETKLKKEFEGYSQNDRDLWEKNNWLEYRIIDGERMYFKRAVSNLRLILNKRGPNQSISKKPVPEGKVLFCLEHSRKVIEKSGLDSKPVLPVKMYVTYQISVKPDAIPEGEIIRCWLPFPRENHDRQQKVEIIETMPEKYFMAPDTLSQRSIYMEQKAVKGKSTVFQIKFDYNALAQYFALDKKNILPYDTSSIIYKQNTSQQVPQIVFTDRIKCLSDSIVNGISDPVQKVKKLYYWINNHIIWTGALEYSIMPNITDYVLTNKRGDCGMQTLLFMSMARCQGIPVKWQSGWMMHPGRVNLHDWCEVYYQGVGWVPLDMSFNLQPSDDLREKEFYINGIDAYRMIVNDAISAKFVPSKKYPRSEPYDFQRGEVEWRKGNLYFDQWSYDMKVDYR